MGYYIDLSAVSLMEYKEELKKGYLPPSRQMLKEDIEERFGLIAGQGAYTAEDLLEALKTGKRTQDFAQRTGLSTEYLIILSREIRSLIKKPPEIAEFTLIKKDAAEKLKALGFKNAAQIYDKLLTEEDRKSLSEKTGIKEDELLLIARLCDLSRIRWVNHTFSQILYQIGYQTAKEVAVANDETLHSRVNEYIKQNGIYRDGIGINDIRICIDVAGKLKHELG